MHCATGGVFFDSFSDFSERNIIHILRSSTQRKIYNNEWCTVRWKFQDTFSFFFPKMRSIHEKYVLVTVTEPRSLTNYFGKLNNNIATKCTVSLAICKLYALIIISTPNNCYHHSIQCYCVLYSFTGRRNCNIFLYFLRRSFEAVWRL